MPTLTRTITSAVNDFEHVCRLAKVDFSTKLIEVDLCLKPHTPPTRLPKGKIAVYAFFNSGVAVKIGKAGPKSGARYVSQHYHPDSARSTLAGSILADPHKIGAGAVTQKNVGAWIKKYCDRVNLLLPAESGYAVLSLLEAFLHARFQPIYEGPSRPAE